MARLVAPAFVLLLLAMVVVDIDGQPDKQQKVKCHNKAYPDCFNKDLYCPVECPKPKVCDVDCASCQAVCVNPPPPPIVTPSPPVATPSPPPDSSEAAAGKRVRCRNRNYTSCYMREHRCPAACPDYCQVDCVTCSPVCGKLLFHFITFSDV